MTVVEEGRILATRRTISMRYTYRLIALSCAVFCLGSITSAQNAYYKDEIFGGYSWLAPNGWEELNYKANNIPNSFDVSNTYYFCRFCNLGWLLDGSGHYKGGTTPPNLLNGSSDSTGVGYALTGLQYKWHSKKFSPFVRGLLGAANISPDCCHGTQWAFAAGAGGGLDWNLSRRISLRPIQADYIYSSYSHIFLSNHPSEWNSVRLAAGLVFNFGSKDCNPQPKACMVTAAGATEVWAGEPVKFSARGSNFPAKDTLNSSWKSSGGRLSEANAATEIDTTGMAPGSYSISATITDPEVKKMNSATCSGTFIIKQPHPPVVSCSVSPSTISIGESALASLAASSPDDRPLTYSWSTTGGQLSASGASATLTVTKADLGNTITVTGTASDGVTHPQNSSCTITAKLPAAEKEKCIIIGDWGECTFEKDRKRPWRVDNDCKDTLDKLSLRLEQMPDGKLDIVGYTDEKEVVREKTLGAQRSVNVKYYLTVDGPNKVDAARIQVRQGGIEEGKATHFYFVAEGPLCSGQLEQGTVVDETLVQGKSRMAPARQKGTAKANPAAPPTP